MSSVAPPLFRSVVASIAISFAAAGAFVACEAGDEASSLAPSADGGKSATPSGDAGTVSVQILAINDFHGNLQPPTGSSGQIVAPSGDPAAVAAGDAGIATDAGTVLVPTGGAAYLAAHIKAARATNPNTVLVSAGDLTGASPLLSNLFKDEPSVLAMNAMGLDIEAVGNHDFDRGLTELLRLQKGGCSLGDCDAGRGQFAGAKFEYLAANVDDTSTNQTIFPPYAVKSFSGAKVAFIGMTLEDTPGVTVASAVAGLEFDNEVATVNALLPDLKKQGADAIVVVLHQGAFQDATGTYDSCAGLNGDLVPILKELDRAVDVVVSAHTHAAYDCTIDGRLVTSAASFGRLYTKIDLTIDTAAHKVVSKSAKNMPNSHDVTPDPDVASIVADYETRSAPLANRVVGYISTDLGGRSGNGVSCELPLGDVIADAQLAATKDAANGGAQIAFMNPGGIRGDLSKSAPGKDDGDVTYAEAFSVQPFANLLVTVSMTGAQIATALAQQFSGSSPKILQVSTGFTYTYAYDKTTNAATIDPATIKLDGTAIDPSATYRVTANAFVAGGGDGFAVFKETTDPLTGGVDLDALTAFLTANSSPTSPLPTPTVDRITGNGCAP